MSAIPCMSARRIDGEYVQIKMYSPILATATNEHARTLRDSLSAALGDGGIDRDGLADEIRCAVLGRGGDSFKISADVVCEMVASGRLRLPGQAKAQPHLSAEISVDELKDRLVKDLNIGNVRAELIAGLVSEMAASGRLRLPGPDTDALRAQLDAVTKEREDLARMLADATDQRDAAISERDAAQERAKMASDRADEGARRLAVAESERDELAHALADAAGQRDQAIRERDEARAAAAEAVRALRDAVDSAPELTGSQIDIAAHPLYPILISAIQQAMYGKGERHGGCSTSFLDQPWRDLAQAHGRGGLTFQAEKKIREAASRGLTGEPFEREVLGAVVYIGMAILWDRESLAAAPSEDVPI